MIKSFQILSLTTSHPNIFTLACYQFQCKLYPNAFIFQNAFHGVFYPQKHQGICYQVHLVFSQQSFSFQEHFKPARDKMRYEEPISIAVCEVVSQQQEYLKVT